MRKEIIDRGLVTGLPPNQPLALTVLRGEGGEVHEGVVVQPDGYWYPIIEGVPSFLRGDLRPDFNAFARQHGLEPVVELPRHRDAAADQLKTNATFSDKWRRFRRYGLEEGHAEFLFSWYCKKLGLADREALEAFYRDKRVVLEVGSGSGFNTRFIAEHCPGIVFAVDVSEAAFTTHENTRDRPNCHVLQADLMDLPFADGMFDLIVADGVLHHTPNTRLALAALYRKLASGGRLFFYVYRRMGAARQLTDEHLRRAFMSLEPEACYEACEGLTELGRELSRIDARVRLEKGVPALGIPPGEHDVQRLIYYNFVKCFWNDAFDFATNNMVNFDWYHPHHAWQHTEEEVAGWLTELGVKDYAFHQSNPNGISVLLTKP